MLVTASARVMMKHLPVTNIGKQDKAAGAFTLRQMDDSRYTTRE
jgi:hypothetical protein